MMAPGQPHVDAAVEEPGIPEHLARHHRADAVGADEQVGLPRASVLEAHAHRVLGLLEADAPVAGMDDLRREDLEHALVGRRPQHAIVPSGQAGHLLDALVEGQARAQVAFPVAELRHREGAEVFDVHAVAAQDAQHGHGQHHAAGPRRACCARTMLLSTSTAYRPVEPSRRPFRLARGSHGHERGGERGAG